MKIAVVSTDGINVDDHFGKAERFLVFDLGSQPPDQAEVRPSLPLSVNDPNHPFDVQRFTTVVDVIKDCDKVYMTQIGDIPANKLKERSIEPVIYKGPIAWLLASLKP
ncbi:MAG: hypothetical protein HQK58_16820 [Deltaproteobacteria bacterium]|nr:hypothetical protein [Deltaproteobacteria bacterium]